MERFLRLDEVRHITGIPTSTIYYLIKRQEFPAQVKLARNMVGWREAEISKWQRKKIAERDGVELPEDEADGADQ